MKIFWLIITGTGILLISFFLIVYRGNNRLSVWFHHGIRLSASAQNIEFNMYPGVMAHLVNLDDGASTQFDFPEQELMTLLKENNCQLQPPGFRSQVPYKDGEDIPADSVLNRPFPFTLMLKSTTGDFLWLKAEKKTTGLLHIRLATDWN